MLSRNQLKVVERTRKEERMRGLWVQVLLGVEVDRLWAKLKKSKETLTATQDSLSLVKTTVATQKEIIG